jgi:hypothetical protein
MATEDFDTQEDAISDADANETFGADVENQSKKKGLPVSPATMMLVGMAIVGVAAVYVLRLRVGPEIASAEQLEAETRVDAALMLLNQASDPNAMDTESVVGTFYYDATERQVPPWKLAGNPFVFEAPKPPEKEPSTDPAYDDSASGAHRGVANARQHMARALQAVRELELQSVLMGPREPMAMISSNLLARGQMIEGWTVAEIRPREVVLSWGTETHLLVMAE